MRATIRFETDFEEKLHKSTDQNTHQVHATVPLTDTESICIISVGPLPYVLYTAGKLVRIIKHCHFDQFSRSRFTSFHLWPSSSLCSDLEPGLNPIHVSIAIHRPGWRSGCPPSSWAPRQPASVLLGEKNSSCLTLVQRFHRHVQPDDPQSPPQPQVVDRCLTPDLVTGLSNAKVVKTLKQSQNIHQPLKVSAEMFPAKGEPGGVWNPRWKRNEEQDNDQDSRHKRGQCLEVF